MTPELGCMANESGCLAWLRGSCNLPWSSCGASEERSRLSGSMGAWSLATESESNSLSSPASMPVAPAATPPERTHTPTPPMAAHLVERRPKHGGRRAMVSEHLRSLEDRRHNGGRLDGGSSWASKIDRSKLTGQLDTVGSERLAQHMPFRPCNE